MRCGLLRALSSAIDGEIPAGSKTPLGVAKQKCIVHYDFSEMDIGIGRFEAT